LLRFRKFALERENEREIVADAAVAAGLGDGLPQRRFGPRQLLGQRVGKAEV